MFLSCPVRVSEWIRCSHSYLYNILVFNYYTNAMQIVKAEKNVFYLIYFHCYNLLLYFLFETRFLVNMQYFGNHRIVTSFLKSIIIFCRKWYINDMKTIFLVFCYKKYLFLFYFFWDTLKLKWINIKLNINKLLLCKVSL